MFTTGIPEERFFYQLGLIIFHVNSAVNPKIRTAVTIGLQQCAIAGMSLALLPNWLIDRDLEVGTLIDVLPNYDVTATNFNIKF